ncbi:hypothetical protein ONZ45_g16225 [Pleurotus djamor]|nr:hypothetical protein ONZ45_g16225 [Pleurotus djamor]
MPPLRKHFRNKAANFSKRRLSTGEPESPRKRRKGTNRDENKENVPNAVSDAERQKESLQTQESDIPLPSPSFAQDTSPFHTFQIKQESLNPQEASGYFVHQWSIKDEETPMRLLDEGDIEEMEAVVQGTDCPRFQTPTPEFPSTPPVPPNSPTYPASYESHIASDGYARRPPTVVAASAALSDLLLTLRGKSRGKAGGYAPPDLDPFVRHRLEGMKSVLSLFTNPQSQTFDSWGASSMQAAVSGDRGTHCAQILRQLCRKYIEDRTVLPVNPYGDWNESMLSDEALTSDILLHLQGLGEYITAEQLLVFLSREDVMRKHGIDKRISLRTAQRWIKSLGYRFHEQKKGQYVDGHERPDVIWYRKHVFLQRWKQLEKRMEMFDSDGFAEFGPRVEGGKPVLVHFHDETIFYANDRRRKTWYHKEAPAKPYAKGEGASLMIADFVSSKFGFLKSLDGSKSARRVLKPGKSRDGYFDAEGIQEQAALAMDILESDYPEYDHILVYDNATTHLKRPEDSLSATKMPRGTSKSDKNWLVDVCQRDESGNLVYNSSGTPLKRKTQMQGAKFSDGTPQSLYFPDDHPTSPGLFKGTAVILEERGFDVQGLRAQCQKFSCKANREPPFDCCCRRLLFNQPDFTNVESILETQCRARGFEVLYLPKFHCELNFIEQCWGYAKRLYRLNPASTLEADLVKNALEALDSIPLNTMRRFANRATRFMDAYHQGLDGKQSAWAAKKYRGHRVLPRAFFEDEARGKHPF